MQQIFKSFQGCLEKITKPIGRGILGAALVLVYILTVLPTGLIMRLMRRDRLRFVRDGDSYWVNADTKAGNYELRF